MDSYWIHDVLTVAAGVFVAIVARDIIVGLLKNWAKTMGGSEGN